LLPFLRSNLFNRQANFSWTLDSQLLALLVRDSLANFTRFVGADLLWPGGARFARNDGTLLGWEWVTLLFLLDSAILLGVLLAILLVGANLLGHIIANLFVLVMALFPWHVLASLGWFISAHLVRDIAANFGRLVDADSLVVNGRSVDLFGLLGEQLFLLLTDLLEELLLDGTLRDLVLLFGHLIRQLANLISQLGTHLGVEVDNLLAVLGNLSVILTVKLGFQLVDLGGEFAVDLMNLVRNLILDLVQLVADLALDLADLLQELVLQRLALPDGFRRLVDSDRCDGLGQRNWNLTTNLLGGSGALLGVFGTADTFVGDGTSPILVGGADLARISFALTLMDSLTLWLVLAELFPNHVAIRNGEH